MGYTYIYINNMYNIHIHTGYVNLTFLVYIFQLKAVTSEPDRETLT